MKLLKNRAVLFEELSYVDTAAYIGGYLTHSNIQTRHIIFNNRKRFHRQFNTLKVYTIKTLWNCCRLFVNMHTASSTEGYVNALSDSKSNIHVIIRI